MKRRSKIVVALAAISALGAVPTASASATEAQWYVGGTKLAENTPTAITATATGTSALTVTIATVHIEITCTAMMSSAGTMLNPTGAGMGTASGVVLVFSGCTVDPTSQHCSVTGVTVGDPTGTITTASLKGTAEAGMKFTVEPTTGPGTKLVELELSGCASSGLNRAYPVTGTATGVESPTGSGTFVFNSTSGSALKLGGISAVFESTIDLTATTPVTII
jgi:hypothetical protein